MHRKLSLAIISLLAIPMLFGCGRQNATTSTALEKATAHQKGYPITVTDDLGRKVVIPNEPKRIVSISPSNTEILFALGLADRVVGVTHYCDYPPEAKKKSKIGDMNVSVEKVLSLRPDLILAHGYLNDNVIQRFERLKLQVVAIDARSFSAVEKDITLVGRVCGKEPEAKAICSRIDATVKQVSSGGKAKHAAKAMLVIQGSPLWLAGPNTLADETLTKCGAENIAHDAKPGFTVFPVEKALARDPEVIIVGRENEKRFFETSPVWKNSKAVRSGKVVLISSDMLVRPGPRIVDGLKAIDKAVNSKS